MEILRPGLTYVEIICTFTIEYDEFGAVSINRINDGEIEISRHMLEAKSLVVAG